MSNVRNVSKVLFRNLVCKRTPLEGCAPDSSRGVLLRTVLDEGVNGKLPWGGGFLSIK